MSPSLYYKPQSRRDDSSPSILTRVASVWFTQCTQEEEKSTFCTIGSRGDGSVSPQDRAIAYRSLQDEMKHWGECSAHYVGEGGRKVIGFSYVKGLTEPPFPTPECVSNCPSLPRGGTVYTLGLWSLLRHFVSAYSHIRGITEITHWSRDFVSNLRSWSRVS